MNIEKSGNERIDTILMVDDSPVNLGVVVEGLESHGYEVLVALDGEEALRRLDVVLPDLILLDVMMPGMDGFEVCRRLKEREDTRAIPVIFMTSLDSTVDKVAGFAAGAVDYITKPLQYDEVRARVGVHLKLRALQRELESSNNQLTREIAERKRVEGELLHHADFQQILLNAMNEVGLQVMMVENGKIIHVGNRRLARQFGYTDAELDAHPALLDIIHPDDRARVADNYRRRLAGEAVSNSYELGLVTRTGERHEFEVAIAVVPCSNPLRIVTVGKDITERKRMEAALQENRESLNEAQRIAQVGSWELNLVGNVLTWSDEIFRLFEIDPRQFGASYQAFLDAIHPDDREAVNRAYTESLESRAPYEIEHRLRMADGRVKYVHERCETHYAEDGKPLRSLGTVQDITARKALEEALAEREREFRTLAENSPDIVVRYDRDCRFVYANPQFQKRLGHTMEQLRGKRPSELPGLLEAEFIEPKVREVLLTGIANEFEHPIRTPDGRVLWGLVHIVPEFDEAGRVAYAQILTRDISALKEAEHNLAESREQLRELAKQWDSEQEEEHKRLAWEVHEGMGQNLMALRMSLQILGEGSDLRLRERAGEMLAMVDDTVRQVRDVTVALRPRVLDFGLSAALEWLAGEFGARHGIACEIDLPEMEIPLDERDASLLFRVAEETFSHIARRGGGSRVKVTLEQAIDICRITLREQGREIDATSPTAVRSFGLGWIEEQITVMGGEFVMFDLPGQGAVIEATLPMQASL